MIKKIGFRRLTSVYIILCILRNEANKINAYGKGIMERFIKQLFDVVKVRNTEYM